MANVFLLFSHSVMSDSLQLCPSLSPRTCSNSCPFGQWYHPTISSCHPLLLPPSVFPNIRVFSTESVLHIRRPKYWSFSFSIIPSNEYKGLISFRTDCLISMLSKQLSRVFSWHNNSKASILCYPAFFWSNFHICTWVLEKPYLWLDGSLSAK